MKYFEVVRDKRGNLVCKGIDGKVLKRSAAIIQALKLVPVTGAKTL